MGDGQWLDEIAAGFAPELDVAVGKWFGKPCLKVGGKVFAALWGGDVAFKLAGEVHAKALQVPGAHLFDPRGQGHPMKEWVQVPAAQSSIWRRFAELACTYVAGAAQAKKDEVVSGLIAARQRILDAVSSLSPAAGDVAFVGTWSIKDLLAHLVGWDRTNLEAVQEILAGRRPGFWAHYDRDWQTYNARLVKAHRKDDLAEMIAAVEESHRELIDFLQGIPAEEYARQRKVVTLLRAEIKDEQEHGRQIADFSARARAESSVGESRMRTETRSCSGSGQVSEVRLARPGDEAEIRQLLAGCELPYQDITSAHLRHFMTLRDEERLTGVVGLEMLGRHALLRSLAVPAQDRGRGIGSRLTEAAEAHARDCGIEVLYLLTTTAEGFFAMRGYHRIERTDAPARMQETTEFRSLCPISAVCMTKQLA